MLLGSQNGVCSVELLGWKTKDSELNISNQTTILIFSLIHFNYYLSKYLIFLKFCFINY
jgi:hypothetical protein